MEQAVETRKVPVPQEVADQHTLVAQKYAGFLVGHPYRADQQRSTPDAIHVEDGPWVEPAVIADDCEFCKRLTDESAVARVAGYQRVLVRESIHIPHDPLPMEDLPLRLKRKLCIEWNHVYTAWLATRPEVWYDFEQKEFLRLKDERDVGPEYQPPYELPEDFVLPPGVHLYG